MAKRIPFGFIYFPGMRASAYLDVLVKLDLVPSVIISMKNTRARIEGVEQQANLNNYNERYFAVDLDLDTYLDKYQVEHIETNAQSINDEELAKVLATQKEKSWIFTGGGILKGHLFQQGRRFLHIHPGKLPDFRGSTCFYYSLLKQNSLSASAFFLEEKLDSGEVLLSCDFSVNQHIDQNSSLFMDHILDPWIRAVTLKRLLQKMLSDETSARPNKREDSEQAPRAYYVMHPVLRALTVNKLNQSYCKTSPNGIIEVER